MAGEILAAWANGVLGELADVPEKLRGVAAEDVARVARRAFDPEVRAEYVVRGRNVGT